MNGPPLPAPAPPPPDDAPRIQRRRRLATALRHLAKGPHPTPDPVAARIRELAADARIAVLPDLDEADLLARLDLAEPAPPEVVAALAAILLTLLPGRRP